MGQWEEWTTRPLRHGDHHHHPNSSQQNPSSSAPTLFFPCLRELEIQHCPNLKELPPLLPPTLRHLRLVEVGVSCFPAGLWGCNCCGGGTETTSSSHLPSATSALSTLHIHKCFNLTSISGLLRRDLPSLEEIDIENCEELVSLLPERGLGHLVSLEKLRIESCPRLTSPPVIREEEEEDNPSRSQHLPCSLKQLHIQGCGDAMGGWWWAGLQCLTSLAKLSLHGCPTTAESLFVSLGRHRHHRHSPVTDLKELVIRGFRCDNQREYTTPTTSSPLPPPPPPPPPPTCPSNPPLVEDASAGVFRALTSLTDLTMNEIPNVLQKWGGGGLPSSLETLGISGNVRSSLNLSHLSSLVSLEIDNFPSIQSLPAMPSSLEELNLYNLANLCSLPNNLSRLSSLQRLDIGNCPSIQSLSAMPISLEKLTLHNLGNLCSLPNTLSHLSSLESVYINNCPSIQSLPPMPTSLSDLLLSNLENLCSLALPNTLSRLSSLQSLYIGNCPSIQSLPAMPPSLSELSLCDLKNLESLPDMSSCLPSLWYLHISRLSIQSLPAAGLPTSLRTLRIYSCPSLKERYRFGTKSMWPEVSHVRQVWIDDEALQ